MSQQGIDIRRRLQRPAPMTDSQQSVANQRAIILSQSLIIWVYLGPVGNDLQHRAVHSSQFAEQQILRIPTRPVIAQTGLCTQFMKPYWRRTTLIILGESILLSCVSGRINANNLVSVRWV